MHEIRRSDLTRARVQERVHEALQELRASDERALNPAPELPEWHEGRALTDVLTAITEPAISAARLAPRSVQAYQGAVRALRAHAGELTIKQLWEGATIKAALRTIASERGPGTAKQSEKVLNRYVYRPLEDYGHDRRPPRFASMGYAPSKRAPVVKATITDEEYQHIRNHLLTRDASTPLPGANPRYQREGVLQRHASVVQLTLVQMGTGLRIAEACALRWGDVVQHPRSGNAYVQVQRGKGRIGQDTGRTALVTDSKIAAWLLSERDEHRPDAPVVPSPQRQNEPWNHDNANKAVSLLYDDMGQQLDIPALVTERDADGAITRRGLRSHIWRSVLNRRLSSVLPQELRAQLFGHTTAVNAAHYTDAASLNEIEQMLGRHSDPAPIVWQ